MRRALLLLLASCTDEAPANPSFQQDVAPIIQENCAKCHGLPQVGGAVTFWRVSYTTYPGSTAMPISNPDLGTTIKMRVETREMPPRIPLRDEQIETIVRWIDQGQPRGEPRPGNRRPVVGLPVVVGTGSFSEIIFDIHDPDGDLVGGYIHEMDIFRGEIHQGRNRLPLTATGTHALTAVVDDGGDVFTLDLGTVRILP